MEKLLESSLMEWKSCYENSYSITEHYLLLACKYFSLKRI